MRYCHDQKKIAVVNDLSGFGRCSLTVALPVISAMRVQACPVPTAILSNHTGFESFFFEDYTSKMEAYVAEWRKLSLSFDGICTGFLGSEAQIAFVEKFLGEFGCEGAVTLVDPVMGDDGEPYATYTERMCCEMRCLARRADILTPNLTEACMLTDTPYREDWERKQLEAMAEKLIAMGPERVVVTGIFEGDFVANLCCQKGKKTEVYRSHRVGVSRSGTGDIFAAVLAADAVNGTPFVDSVQKASEFIGKCIESSLERGTPLEEGVCFEQHLDMLM